MTRTDISKSNRAKLSERLKKLRASLGITQSELAKEFRVTQGAIAHWESGERAVPGPISKLIELYELRIK
ncbi:MAG: helix-turn-helix domain-containing protein [Bdellovibrionales bacterium]|nr:helix-turn-helix domain-containing protein [Bdellovibrionales bacterium]